MIRERAEIRKQEEIAPGIFSMVLKTKAAVTAMAGQFVSLYTNDPSRLLPRPVSICESDPEQGVLRLVYRVAGAGTREFSKMQGGTGIDVLGPLGNGYPVTAARPVLLGGGIGIPPMLFLAETFRNNGVPKENVHVFLGYRDTPFLLEEFEKISTVHISSDSGKIGFHGNAVACAEESKVTGDALFSCGPLPMLRGVKAFGEKLQVPCYISMEERMACGIGACLGCVCRSVDIDGHSAVRNKRVCKDGPVFDAEEVVL